MLDLTPSEELATRMGYSAPTNQFRTWLKTMNTTPVPGRRGYYDPSLVRRRLDAAPDLLTATAEASDSLVAKRRARRAQG